MTRAALYCRLSREDEGLEGTAESESIQNQRSMLLAWADRLGCAVQGIYCDEDYSGADRDRPAFNRMIAAARAGQIDVILAKSQSRFTRDMELVEKYLHGLFPLWGVRFLALVDHVDTADPAGKKSRQIYGLMNEWYLEDLSANVRAVLTHKRRQGCSIASGALYGYRKDPDNKGHLLVDPEAAERLHPADEKRILRALEVYRETGKTISAHNAETRDLPPRYDAVWIGLQFRDRADMKTLIDRRVDAMVAAGLLEEVGQLLESGLPREATALQAIGYKEFLGVLDGTATVEEAVAEVKLRSRQYAKRQLTWLRRNPDIHWIWWEKDRDFARALQVSTEILAAAGVF